MPDDPENLDELLDKLPGHLARKVAEELNAELPSDVEAFDTGPLPEPSPPMAVRWQEAVENDELLKELSQGLDVTP